MSFYGDPDELDRLAQRVSSRAEEVRRLADLLEHSAEALHWHGVAAETYRSLAAEDRRRLQCSADQLDAAAAVLRSHAQEVRDRLGRIRRIESAARELVSSTLDRVADSVRLPPPGHLDWLDAGELLTLDAGKLSTERGAL